MSLNAIGPRSYSPAPIDLNHDSSQSDSSRTTTGDQPSSAGSAGPASSSHLGTKPSDLQSLLKAAEADFDPRSQECQKFLEQAKTGDANAQGAIGYFYANGLGVNKDLTKAREWYEISAAQGNAMSRYYLDLLNGKSPVPPDQSSYIKSLHERAEKGDADAQACLGARYEWGSAVEQNTKKAHGLYEQAAAQGHVGALFNLGASYHIGLGVPQCSAIARKWYERAAASGSTDAKEALAKLPPSDATETKARETRNLAFLLELAEANDREAQYEVGKLYDLGAGVKQSYAFARHWYERAAANGHAWAECNLGLLYHLGHGVHQDYVTACSCYNGAAAKGNSRARFLFGLLHEESLQDYKTAMLWYKKAAEEGHAGAKEALVKLPLSAPSSGSTSTHQTASIGLTKTESSPKTVPPRALYEKAEALGHAGALAATLNSLGLLNHPGPGIGANKHYATIHGWYEQCAAQGHARALYALGFMHDIGLGVNENTETARKYYEEAAALGHVSAKNALARLLSSTSSAVSASTKAAPSKPVSKENKSASDHRASSGSAGMGTPAKSVTESSDLESLRKRVEENDPEAQFNLGLRYDRGEGVEKNCITAHDLYEQAAANGHTRAQFNLGLIFEEGQNYVMARKWFEEAAAKGHDGAKDALKRMPQSPSLSALAPAKAPGAKSPIRSSHMESLLKQKQEFDAEEQFKLGLMAEENQQYGLAHKMFEKAAAGGHVQALFNLAWFYDEGLGVPQNYGTALHWYERAAAKGHALAQFILGCWFREGFNVGRNLDTARDFFAQAAHNGHAGAKEALAQLRLPSASAKQESKENKNKTASDQTTSAGPAGAGSPSKPATESPHIKSLIKEAEAGNVGTQCYLGLLFMKGEGVTQNYATAYKWFEQAAAQRNSEALFNLGFLHEKGLGVDQNSATARVLYDKAAAKGHARAKQALAKLPLSASAPARAPSGKQESKTDKNQRPSSESAGIGSPPKAAPSTIELLLERAKGEDAEAEYNLGMSFSKGQGVPQNYAIAREWLAKAAAKNHTQALFVLGCMHRNGLGGDRNPILARDFFVQAAARGHAGAQFNLGVLSEKGQGVEQCYVTARRWYTQAAAPRERAPVKEHAESQFSLGVLHEKGLGVAQNNIIARLWYEKAEANGHVPAKTALARLPSEKFEGKEDDTATDQTASAGSAGAGSASKSTDEPSYAQFSEDAEAGDAEAQFVLGWHYDDGSEKNYLTARMWYERAAANGHADAKEALEKLDLFFLSNASAPAKAPPGKPESKEDKTARNQTLSAVPASDISIQVGAGREAPKKSGNESVTASSGSSAQQVDAKNASPSASSADEQEKQRASIAMLMQQLQATQAQVQALISTVKEQKSEIDELRAAQQKSAKEAPRVE